MPNEEQWEKYFDPKGTLKRLGLNHSIKDVADFGSGYGTFTLPAAQIISGNIYALEIDPDMVKTLQQKAKKQNLKNLKLIQRDFTSEGSGLDALSVNFVMLFNILHSEKPTELLKEAYRILRQGGKVGIIHWNFDASTPRGPPMNIRSKPEQIRMWAESVGFIFEKQLDLKPYHYGLVLRKGE